MAAYKILVLPIRIVQALFAVIILGVMAYATNAWASGWWSPDSINYTIFCSVWTLLAVAYLVFAPMSGTVAAHKFGILAADALTCLFWFAAWIAVASFLGDGCNQHWGPCRAAVAGDIFSAFIWLLFCATTIFSALHCWNTRGTKDSAPPPEAIEIPRSHPHPATTGTV